jgi:hypothetical protein
VRIIPDVRAGAGLWAMFWSLLIGLVTAIIGALAGGSMPRNTAMYRSEAGLQSSYASDRGSSAAH